MSHPIPIVVIKREPSKKRIGETYEKYNNKNVERRRQNATLFPVVQKILNSFPGIKKRSDILPLAQVISKEIGVKLDRTAKRLNEGLICWFCENWDKAKMHLLNAYIIATGGKQALIQDFDTTINDHSMDLDIPIESFVNDVQPHPVVSNEIGIFEENEVIMPDLFE
ncbi:hypothetical protein TVAG_348760 [Trichomonas vaginalis G3]|uniref:Uncharacterized protein n=1 Tax=Trichomonas vaginalis (strain ATCC PRA-98 / G3) TaxID=412133 RepID=A2G3P1_TRIV3|nr:hypothetical protein TVAGG3_0756550 [Trichomonas vaginalis G3]EAX88234.1 hypothetical protein TVAG_348760 [Trichomonas vaginalis G3]KAI5512907.1 hypothetical protein TVAGG3_0756550 [Trichomonas vaginalis G3]|eukprot:XP_001301164.1 hypothetical protein [Trichomonas vaginalis G3]